MVFIAVNLSVIRLRFKRSSGPRGFTIPGRVKRLTLIPVLALASVVTMMAFLERDAWLIGGACLAVGAVVGLTRRSAIRQASATSR